MKKLSIQSTAFPNGDRITYSNGMDAPKVKDYSKVMKQAVMNQIRKGGVCHIDGQESALNQAKQLIEVR